MRARCGRCGSGFEVMGPGRYACPACGTTNEVRGAAAPPGGMGPGGMPPMGAEPPPPPPLPPEKPSARVRCADKECGFSFIVGDVSEAPCPMCGTTVAVDPRPAPPPDAGGFGEGWDPNPTWSGG